MNALQSSPVWKGATREESDHHPVICDHPPYEGMEELRLGRELERPRKTEHGYREEDGE